MGAGAETNVGEKPGYIFELTADLGCGRNYSIRGNFPVNTTLELMNTEMDKLVRVCDRQLSKAIIPNIEEKLRKEENALLTFENNLKTLKKQAEGHKSIPAVAQGNIDNASINVNNQAQIVAEQKKLLERVKKDAE